MSSRCPECGAAVPEGGSCRDNFHALLLLEAEVPGGPGEVPHFHAVAAYVLQHPASMNYTAAALEGLRVCLADSLAGRATLEQIRRRVRQGAAQAGRITRRGDEPVVGWGIASWPLTVADVCAAGVEDYAGRVAEWARSVCRALDAGANQAGVGRLS